MVASNSVGSINYGDCRYSYTVSKKLCYELDPEYFIKKAKQYRRDNLEFCKFNQKCWYDNKPEVIQKRLIKQNKINSSKEEYEKYIFNKKKYQKYKESFLTRYQKTKYNKVMDELLNPQVYIPITNSYLTIKKQPTTLLFN